MNGIYCTNHQTYQYVDNRDKLVAYVGTIDNNDVKQEELIA